MKSKKNTLFSESRRFLVFAVGGGLGALLNLGVTFLLTEFGGFWYLFSYIIGSFANMLFNFSYHRSITFGVKDRFKKRLAKSMGVTVGIGIATLALIYFFTDILKIWYILSGIISIAAMAVLNFALNRNWVFNEESAQNKVESREEQ